MARCLAGGSRDKSAYGKAQLGSGGSPLPSITTDEKGNVT